MSSPVNAHARRIGPDPFERLAPDAALWPRMLERQLEWVGHGAHIGCISSTPAERLRVLGAFFGGGLRYGAHCVYFADPDRARELTELVRTLGPVESAEHSGEPRIFSDDELLFLFLETIGHLLANAFATASTAVSFRVLVENAPDLIIRFGADLRILYANPAIERVTGTAAESLIGATSANVGVVEALVPTWELLLSQVWRTGREQAFELTVRNPTGERVFESRIIPEVGPDGAVQSVLTISRDVTEQRRAEADRAALSRQLLEQQNRVQELMRDRERALERSTAALHAQLSARERHILRLLAAGWTNRQIGAELGLTSGTIKNQVALILSKLNVTDRTQAAVRAVQLGLIDDTAHY